MIIRYIILVTNILFFAGSTWWFFTILFNLLFNSVTFVSVRFKLLLTVGFIVVSLVCWIIRKTFLPVPGIDYK